ncbi:MAG: anaerobic ribonucleoside-triphosphate reductase activating protein [Desulfovibrio sp.]|nr:MAG: anaerobic ribonucleoside-triphosphate reductase activating protein [Desulfovibrio sp.]
MTAPWSSVRGIEPMSLCDWPGKTACVLFMGGCNLRCPTCHNAELAWRPDWFSPLPRESVERFLTSRHAWLDGIVISGGEPTLVPGLDDLLRDLKSFNLPIKIDSNGMQPKVLERLLKQDLIQAAFVDIKGPFAKYPQLTGTHMDPKRAEASLNRIFDLANTYPGVFVFRQTRVPALTDMDVEESRSYLPQGYSLKMQTFVPPRRQNAEADSEAGRLSGNVVAGPDRAGHSQSAQSQWGQGPDLGKAVGA